MVCRRGRRRGRRVPGGVPDGKRVVEAVQVTVRVGMRRSFCARRVAPRLFALQLTLAEHVHGTVGPADFVALALPCRVLFVADVLPVIGGGSRDVVRGWSWLVDAAYEHGAKAAMRLGANSIADSLIQEIRFDRARAVRAQPLCMKPRSTVRAVKELQASL